MPQLTNLLTASLNPDPNQPRKVRDAEKQRQLNESIALHGVLQPLGVRADKRTLVWGEGRLIAAVAAALKEVPAVILDKAMAEWEYQNLALVENVVRSDLSQFDLWQGCVRLLEANPGWGPQGYCESSFVIRGQCHDQNHVAVQGDTGSGPKPYGKARSSLATPTRSAKQKHLKSRWRLLNLSLARPVRSRMRWKKKEGRSGTGGVQEAKAARVKIAMPNGSVVLSGNEMSMSEVVELLAGNAQGSPQGRWSLRPENRLDEHDAGSCESELTSHTRNNGDLVKITRLLLILALLAFGFSAAVLAMKLPWLFFGPRNHIVFARNAKKGYALLGRWVLQGLRMLATSNGLEC